MYDLIVFDLDGTISDPLEGIGCSINYALDYHGYESRQLSEVGKYVGPPIDETFQVLTGSTDANHIAALVAKYRERYSDIGFSENSLYPGVFQALMNLHQANVPLGICTSKRRDFAEKILQLFDLYDLFQFIDGGDIGIQKSQQLSNLVANGVATTASFMVGDRAIDITAAHRNGIQAGGVLWGYGALNELEAANPQHLFSSPAELSLLKST